VRRRFGFARSAFFWSAAANASATPLWLRAERLLLDCGGKRQRDAALASRGAPRRDRLALKSGFAAIQSGVPATAVHGGRSARQRHLECGGKRQRNAASGALHVKGSIRDFGMIESTTVRFSPDHAGRDSRKRIATRPSVSSYVFVRVRPCSSVS